MRQAGRSLPEYRKLREEHPAFGDVIKRPDLACEVTMQPVRRHGVDAAILFSDIMTPVQSLVPGVDIHPGKGPVVEQPFRTKTDLDRLRLPSGALSQLGELLLDPIRENKVASVNAFGSGIADDKLLHAYVEEMIVFYLSEEPLLESVKTYDLSDVETRAMAVDRISELVIKPRGGLGGSGVTIVIEPVCLDETNILHYLGEAYALALRVNRPEIRCLCDYYHMERQGEHLTGILLAAPWLLHAHTSGPDRRCPAPGWTQHLFLRALREAGYDRRLSIEARGCGPPGAFGREGADVQLVEHLAGQRHAGPRGVVPAIGAEVHDLRQPVRAVGLRARGRIRVEPVVAVEAEAVA